MLICGVAFGQNYSVTGTINDSAGEALFNATTVVIARSDSTLVGFGVSKENGQFEISGLSSGQYTLQVSYVGKETAELDLNIIDLDIDVGSIQLSDQTEVLEEFEVKAKRVSYIIRGDTIVYQALAFPSRPQDMVEDLLRRLPGIEVDQNGTITSQGEIVENILVEGKEFFGKNPIIATQNLPADAVDQVHVYDKLSDIAELTGIPDGQQEKTVNLELREEAKRGILGQMTGGFGTEQIDIGRYMVHCLDLLH